MASTFPTSSWGQVSSNVTLPTANSSAATHIKVLDQISASICIISSLLGLVGNGMVVWVTSFRMHRTVNTVWFLNLALADLLYSLLLPFFAAKLAMGRLWIFGSFLCKVVNSFLFLSMFASAFQLALISADRCLLVARPIWAQGLRTPQRAWGAAGGAWLLAGAFSAPYLSYRELWYSDKLKGFSCINNYGKEAVNGTRKQTLIMVRFAVGFLVPLLIITACHIAVVLRAGHRSRRSNRMGKVVASVVLSFFLCWLPYHVFNFLHGQQNMQGALKLGASLAFSLTCLSCFLNPLLYTFLGRRFREGLRGSGRARWLEAALAEDSLGSSRRTQRNQSLASTTSSELKVGQS